MGAPMKQPLLLHFLLLLLLLLLPLLPPPSLQACRRRRARSVLAAAHRVQGRAAASARLGSRQARPLALHWISLFL